MPYSMVCFFFGTSDCDFGLYVAGTAIGVTPNVVFFCFVGASMKTMAEAASGADATGGGTAAYQQNSAYWYYFWGSGFAAVVAVTLLTVAAKQHLDELLATALAAQQQRANRRRPSAALASSAGDDEGESAAVVAPAVSVDGHTTTADPLTNHGSGPFPSTGRATAPLSESSHLELNRRP